VIKLHKGPLIQYRYLFGANLSDERNMNRILPEESAIYRGYFDEAPIDLLREAFGEKITPNVGDASPDVEIDKLFLFLRHSNPTVKSIGIERIILQLEDDEIYERLRTEREFDTAIFFQPMASDDLSEVNVVAKIRKRLIYFRKLLVRYLGFIFTDAPK
jgi:hypothetical protein